MFNWIKKNFKKKPDLKKVQCYSCKNYGHYARDCKVVKSNFVVQKICSLETREAKLVSVNAKIDNQEFKVSFDSGATASIMAYKAALNKGLKLNPSEVRVKTAENNISNVRGITD